MDLNKRNKGKLIGLICVGTFILILFGLALSTNDQYTRRDLLAMRPGLQASQMTGGDDAEAQRRQRQARCAEAAERRQQQSRQDGACAGLLQSKPQSQSIRPGYVSDVDAKRILTARTPKKKVLLLGGDHNEHRYQQRQGFHDGIVCLNKSPEYLSARRDELAIFCDFNNLMEMQKLSDTLEGTFDLIVFDWSTWKAAEFGQGIVSAIHKMLAPNGRFIYELQSAVALVLGATVKAEEFWEENQTDYTEPLDGTELQHDFKFTFDSGENTDWLKTEIRELIRENNGKLLKIFSQVDYLDETKKFDYEGFSMRPRHGQECGRYDPYPVLICTK